MIATENSERRGSFSTVFPTSERNSVSNLPLKTIALIIEVKQRRPACVLLQAAFGCRAGLVSMLFDAWRWLLAPTDDIRRVEGTMDEWRRFATDTNAEHHREGR